MIAESLGSGVRPVPEGGGPLFARHGVPSTRSTGWTSNAARWAGPVLAGPDGVIPTFFLESPGFGEEAARDILFLGFWVSVLDTLDGWMALSCLAPGRVRFLLFFFGLDMMVLDLDLDKRADVIRLSFFSISFCFVSFLSCFFWARGLLGRLETLIP